MNTAQLFIIATAALSVPLLTNTRPATFWHRVACAIALVGQPFWLYESMRTGQFGIFLVALWFTALYLFGLLRPAPPFAEPIQYVDLQSRR